MTGYVIGHRSKDAERVRNDVDEDLCRTVRAAASPLQDSARWVTSGLHVPGIPRAALQGEAAASRAELIPASARPRGGRLQT